MSKILFSIGGGALQGVEAGGIVTISLNENLLVGGGKAAGILAIQGQGSVVLSGPIAVALAEADLNSILPAAIEPAAVAVEDLGNAALSNL